MLLSLGRVGNENVLSHFLLVSDSRQESDCTTVIDTGSIEGGGYIRAVTHDFGKCSVGVPLRLHSHGVGGGVIFARSEHNDLIDACIFLTEDDSLCVLGFHPRDNGLCLAGVEHLNVVVSRCVPTVDECAVQINTIQQGVGTLLLLEVDDVFLCFATELNDDSHFIFIL